MTPHEAGEKIVLWWKLEHHLAFISLWISMLYAPFTVDCVKKVVRRYVDESTENKHPTAGKVTWREDSG